jgi:MoxR-like ATPase
MVSAASDIGRAVDAVATVVLGKRDTIRLSMACVLAGGHLLLEDLPGLGKTTLSQALARVLALDYQRIQFTNDVLPADVVGVSIFDREQGDFQFRPGPVFTQVLLADEINRGTPRTQSALLEAMAEQQVSVDGKTRALPKPFFVIATQNPATHTGTYPLPESQLDRFLMRLSLGYPDPDAERDLLLGGRVAPEALNAVLDSTKFLEISAAVTQVRAADALLDYVQRLIAFTRTDGAFAVGLSPRGALALLNAAKAWALMADRDHVIPEDIQAVLAAVVAHRVIPAASFAGDGRALVELMRTQVDVVAG